MIDAKFALGRERKDKSRRFTHPILAEIILHIFLEHVVDGFKSASEVLLADRFILKLLSKINNESFDARM